MVIPKYDLMLGDDSNIMSSLTISCIENGTYDKSIWDYDCTKTCHFPYTLEPEVMEHDWTDNQTKPDLGEIIT